MTDYVVVRKVMIKRRVTLCEYIDNNNNNNNNNKNNNNNNNNLFMNTFQAIYKLKVLILKYQTDKKLT